MTSEDSISDKKYLGKYRGIVTKNMDPEGLGRIRTKVPSVMDEKELGWALPCVPYAGNNVGFFFMPPLGSDVWIEFEDGDVSRPIFSGCFWSKFEIPNRNIDPDIKCIKTEHATISINDKSGSNKIEIKSSKDQKIIVTKDSIEIVHEGCSVKISGSEVSINGRNFQVKK